MHPKLRPSGRREVHYAILAILAALLVPFVLIALRTNSRESRLKSTISSLQKENTDLKNKIRASEKEIIKLKDENNEQHEQIAKYSTRIGIPSKYTFDRVMGFLKARSDGKPHCTACLLEFKEIPIDTTRTPVQCPECGAEYPIQARFIVPKPK